MSTRTLSQWLQRIEALHPSEIELGLERVASVYASLPNADVPRVISVAGTNGKGSTVEFVTRCAISQGLRVGTYTSPHLIHFGERMRINGRSASDDRIVEAFEAVERARGTVPLTYFEFTTLAALALFRSNPLDLWVLEVGLGGRLDAVNIVDADVAVITAIGLDHQDWLGDSREAIGHEKAGIMRPGNVAVCSDPQPPSTVERHAQQIGARLLEIGHDFVWTSSEASWDYDLTVRSHDPEKSAPERQAVDRLHRSGLPLPPGAVPDNLAGGLTALAVLDWLPDREQLEGVLNNWSLPGRLQRLDLDVTWWLDVAHNAESAALLGNTLARSIADEERVECYAVLGMLADKPVDDVILALSPLVTHWLVVGLDSSRALSTADLAKRVQRVSDATVETLESVAAGMAVARARAHANACVVVTGSFHTVGPALAWLAPEQGLR